MSDTDDDRSELRMKLSIEAAIRMTRDGVTEAAQELARRRYGPDPAFAGKQPKVKRVIAGREIELTKGRVYTAKWPVHDRGEFYSVLIIGDIRRGEPLRDSVMVHDLSYEEAQDFVYEFNDQEFAFVGRFWK